MEGESTLILTVMVVSVLICYGIANALGLYIVFHDMGPDRPIVSYNLVPSTPSTCGLRETAATTHEPTTPEPTTPEPTTIGGILTGDLDFVERVSHL